MADVRDITEVTIVTEPTGEENLIAEADGSVIRIPSANFSGGGEKLDLEILAYIPKEIAQAEIPIFESDLTFDELLDRLDSCEDINISCKEYAYDENSEEYVLSPILFRTFSPVLMTMSGEVASGMFNLPDKTTILVMPDPTGEQSRFVIGLQEGQKGELVAQLGYIGG